MLIILPSLATWISAFSLGFPWCPLKNPEKPEFYQTKFHKFSVAFNKKLVKKIPGVDCNPPKYRSRLGIIPCNLNPFEQWKKGPWLFRVY